jgi:superfamily II DNA helicase RecQ
VRDHTPMLERLAKHVAQRVFVTGTLPIRMEHTFLNNVFLAHDPPNPPTHFVIRAMTCRPQLAHHVMEVSLLPGARTSLDITTGLAQTLLSLLAPQERMIIFTMQVSDTDLLSENIGCTRYHSSLSDDTKDRHYASWVRGTSRAIVATPALIQGIDYPSVRFVIFHAGAYGLIAYCQGAGRGGRSGSRCDVFTIFYGQGLSLKPRLGDVDAGNEWEVFRTTTQCRVSVITSCLDGHSLECSQIIGQHKCDNCNPSDRFRVLVQSALSGLSLARLASAPKKRLNPGSKRMSNQSHKSCNGEAVEEHAHGKRRRLHIGSGSSATSMMSSNPLHSSVFHGQRQ